MPMISFIGVISWAAIEVLIGVPLRVDDDRGVRLFIANDVRGMREAGKIELFQNHRFLNLTSRFA